eukprot:1175367-Prorocentrum_minimum.AAC.1
MTVNARVGRGSGGGQEGIYRSSLDARKPQNPINSEEYLWHLQGVLYIGVRRGSGGGQEGTYRSSVDAHEPQSPTKSEEYQRHLQ